MQLLLSTTTGVNCKCQVKEARIKSLHPVWFYVHGILEKGKNIGIEDRPIFARDWRRGWRGWRRGELGKPEQGSSKHTHRCNTHAPLSPGRVLGCGHRAWLRVAFGELFHQEETWMDCSGSAGQSSSSVSCSVGTRGSQLASSGPQISGSG